MESLGILQYNSALPLAELHLVADLEWAQKRLLNYRQSDDRYNVSVFPQFELAEVAKNYYARDCTSYTLANL